MNERNIELTALVLDMCEDAGKSGSLGQRVLKRLENYEKTVAALVNRLKTPRPNLKDIDFDTVARSKAKESLDAIGINVETGLGAPTDVGKIAAPYIQKPQDFWMI